MAELPIDVNEDSFWLNEDQMALTPAERTSLRSEGLGIIGDFVDFKDDELTQAFKNMRISIAPVAGVNAVLDEEGAIVSKAIPNIPGKVPVALSTKCMKRLKIASKAYNYYYSIGRVRRFGNMHFTQTLKGFWTEYEAISKLMKEDKPDVPKVTKNTTPLRWIESFKDCCYRTYGVRECPLLYVIRENETFTSEADDPLNVGRAYGSSGSILQEMILRLNHNDPLYNTDNSQVYSMLEEATRGTIYSTTVKAFTRIKDGRRAFLAMVSSHIGSDKWEQLQKENLKFLMNTKWTGKVYSLEKFTGLHRSKFVQLEECQIHVNFQLPSEFTRVGFLLDNVISKDPDLVAALGSIRLGINGMRENFDTAVTFMLPVCPYSKGQQGKGKNPRSPSISALKTSADSKSGVEFRWHTSTEYNQLNPEQKHELYEWQQKNKPSPGKNNRGGPGKSKKALTAKVKSLQAEVAAAKAGKEKDVTETKVPSVDEIAAIIASSSPTKETIENKRKVQLAEGTKVQSNGDYIVAAHNIQKIIKRMKSNP